MPRLKKNKRYMGRGAFGKFMSGAKDFLKKTQLISKLGQYALPMAGAMGGPAGGIIGRAALDYTKQEGYGKRRRILRRGGALVAVGGRRVMYRGGALGPAGGSGGMRPTMSKRLNPRVRSTINMPSKFLY